MIKFNLLKSLACKFSKIFSISQNNSTKSPFTSLFDAIKPVNGYPVTGDTADASCLNVVTPFFCNELYHVPDSLCGIASAHDTTPNECDDVAQATIAALVDLTFTTLEILSESLNRITLTIRYWNSMV